MVNKSAKVLGEDAVLASVDGWVPTKLQYWAQKDTFIYTEVIDQEKSLGSLNFARNNDTKEKDRSIRLHMFEEKQN